MQLWSELVTAPREGKRRRRCALPPQYKEPVVLCSAPAERSGDGALCGDHNCSTALEIIRHVQFIRFETIKGFYLSSGGSALKPCCRTPRVLVRDGHKTMLYCVLMGIIQTREVGFFIGQSRFVKVVPYLPATGFIEAIDPLGCLFVKVAQHFTETGSIVFGDWGMSDEVIVI